MTLRVDLRFVAPVTPSPPVTSKFPPVPTFVVKYDTPVTFNVDDKVAAPVTPRVDLKVTAPVTPSPPVISVFP